jgi:hypothetical protein
VSRNCINVGDDIKNPRYDDLVQQVYPTYEYDASATSR